MKRTTIFQRMFVGLAATAIVASCTQNEEAVPDTQSQVSMKATVADSSDPNARTSSLVYGNLTFTDLKMSVDRVRLHLRATGDDPRPTIVNVNAKGQQVLTLVEDGNILLAPIGDVNAYNGIYGKLNFDLVPTTSVPEEDEMHGHSVLVKADWNGIPAQLALDMEEEVNVQFNKGIEVDGAQELVLTLYMDRLLEGIDPSTIADGNGNGLIEIGPNDEDGNDAIYQQLKANIESSLDMKNGNFHETGK